MNWYPQSGGGSLAQFPVRRVRKWRWIENLSESGARITVPDAGTGEVEWRLSYSDLSDSEVAGLNGLFTASCGTYAPFGFVDPLANLLAWSEDLTRADWQHSSLLVSGGLSDPLGGHAAWLLTNTTGGELKCSQSLGLPGSYVAAFSLWIRADHPVTPALDRDGTRAQAAAGTTWSRVSLGAAGVAGAEVSTFSVVVPAGASVQVFGFQAEAQPFPSQYKPSGAAAGIYPETYFGSDELIVRATGSGLSATDISLVSRV